MALYLENFNYQLMGPEIQSNGSLSRRWVFMHGLMGYGANWQKITGELKGKERILVFDQRGHGRSFKPEGGNYAPENYAEDLRLILEELRWDRIILIGHSMGALNALAFGARYPERLTHLILEDIGAEARPEQWGYFQGLLHTIPTPFVDKKKAKDYFMNEFRKTEYYRLKGAQTLGAYLYSNLEEKEKEGGVVDWRFSKSAILETVQKGRGKDHWDELRSLKTPTLLIRGGQSEELSRDVFSRMQLENPFIQGVQIENAGHWVHADQPQEFLKKIFEFLTRSHL